MKKFLIKVVGSNLRMTFRQQTGGQNNFHAVKELSLLYLLYEKVYAEAFFLEKCVAFLVRHLTEKINEETIPSIKCGTEENLQRLVDELNEGCVRFGLKVNIGKTEVFGMTKRRDQLPVNISLGGCMFKQVRSFKYLGSLK